VSTGIKPEWKYGVWNRWWPLIGLLFTGELSILLLSCLVGIFHYRFNIQVSDWIPFSWRPWNFFEYTEDAFYCLLDGLFFILKILHCSKIRYQFFTLPLPWTEAAIEGNITCFLWGFFFINFFRQFLEGCILLIGVMKFNMYILFFIFLFGCLQFTGNKFTFISC
jgi:hypothetical protein